MIEKDIAINSQGVTLSGTLCLPEEHGQFLTVLMIHGSGPLDRDENMKGQQLDVFNAIAHRLAGIGIASLRYDKRGCRKSSGDFYTAGHFDLVNDAIACFDALEEYEFCQSVFVLGHSEGCIIAPQLHLKRSAIAGLILICPFVDKIDSILLKQAAQLQKEFENAPGFGGRIRDILSRIMGITVASQQRLIDRLKSSNAATIRAGLQRLPAKSLREMMRLDPPVIFRQVTCPMLVIGAEKDLQCDPADVDRIAELTAGSVEKHLIKDLTHILRFDEGEPSILGTVRLLKKPIEPVVLDLIADWLVRQAANRRVQTP